MSPGISVCHYSRKTKLLGTSTGYFFQVVKNQTFSRDKAAFLGLSREGLETGTPPYLESAPREMAYQLRQTDHDVNHVDPHLPLGNIVQDPCIIHSTYPAQERYPAVDHADDMAPYRQRERDDT